MLTIVTGYTTGSHYSVLLGVVLCSRSSQATQQTLTTVYCLVWYRVHDRHRLHNRLSLQCTAWCGTVFTIVTCYTTDSRYSVLLGVVPCSRSSPATQQTLATVYCLAWYCVHDRHRLHNRLSLQCTAWFGTVFTIVTCYTTGSHYSVQLGVVLCSRSSHATQQTLATVYCLAWYCVNDRHMLHNRLSLQCTAWRGTVFTIVTGYTTDSRYSVLLGVVPCSRSSQATQQTLTTVYSLVWYCVHDRHRLHNRLSLQCTAWCGTVFTIVTGYTTGSHYRSRTRIQEHTTPVLKELHWLPVRQRIVVKLLTLVQ
ncbi:uncharacterized protein LOC124271039 [Haliotis rubra]|uniref:uncharacterized protein LOC124271039 n=1 Tax=Haliotis rubra TaxID=36100 RepID=UPI001EE56EA8|nr:uncharacterized protein LOC124271039 [Haliotis rubra]